MNEGGTREYPQRAEQRTLEEIRADIDGVDDALAALFVKRMELCGEVASYKRDHAVAVTQSGREEAITRRLSERCGEPFGRYIPGLYERVFALSKAWQRELIARSGEEAERP